MHEIVHVPVLLQEVLHFLKPKQKERFIDGTVGQGGHAEAILERTSPDGRLLAIDRDPRNLSTAEQRLARFAPRAVFVHDSFANAPNHAYNHGFEEVSGILLDLGFSSAHIEDPSRGFSFQAEGPLDMRYNQIQSLTADIIVNQYSEEDIAKIFRTLGEEPQARKIAQAIVAARSQKKITSTTILAQLVVSAVGGRRGKTHPATKVFQALRIAVNDELGELERALPELIKLLKPGGRIAIIAFHSLEDRIVKQYFAKHDGTTLKNLTKKVVTPTDKEVRRNPRARSAKLRVAEKI